jgi:hypothetical protein
MLSWRVCLTSEIRFGSGCVLGAKTQAVEEDRGDAHGFVGSP